MQDISRNYDKNSIKVYIFDIVKQLNAEKDIICENMCEEGSESKFGSEEGLNVFRTLVIMKW